MNFIHVVRKYMPGHILAYTASLLLGILAQAVVLLQPQLSGALIDGVQQHKAIVLIAVQLGILFILGAVLTAIQQAILGTIGEKSLYSIRNSMVDKFFRMSLLDREQKPPAWYSQRVSNDAALIKSVPSQFLSLVQGIILIVGSGVCLVWLDPIFFVIVLIPAGFSISLMLIATKPVKKLQNNLQNATMDMTSTVQEAAASMRTLEAYNSIDPEKNKIYAITGQAFASGRKLVWLYSSFAPVNQILSQLGNIVAILYGAYQVACGQMEFTSLVMFLMYFSYFSTAINSIVSAIGQMQQAIVGSQRVDEFFTVKEQQDDSAGTVLSLTKAPKVTFKEINHRYIDQTENSLTNVSFTAPPGKITALVGESGGGKTTCLSLVERFFQPTNGQVTVDGSDLAGLHMEKLRKDIAYVEQDPCILTGTIRDNILLGNNTATDDEISQVLKRVGLELDGVSDAQLLDREVGQSGLALSGGQKQRIALARALIRMPKLLLMDEPTSNLDGLAEETIAKLIRQRFGNTTVLYSAHRLSLILEADWIVVIKNGRVLDEGNHEELLGRCDYYKQLIASQEQHTTK